jgi:hypothetical protein
MYHDGAEVTKKTLRQLVTHPVMWQHVLAILQHKVDTNTICLVMERLVQIYQTPEGISTDEFVGESLKDGLEKFLNPVRDINERLTVILWHWCRDMGTAGQTEFPARDLDMERELINPEFVALVKDDWKQLKGLPVGLQVEFCREKGEGIWEICNRLWSLYWVVKREALGYEGKALPFWTKNTPVQAIKSEPRWWKPMASGPGAPTASLLMRLNLSDSDRVFNYRHLPCRYKHDPEQVKHPSWEKWKKMLRKILDEINLVPAAPISHPCSHSDLAIWRNEIRTTVRLREHRMGVRGILMRFLDDQGDSISVVQIWDNRDGAAMSAQEIDDSIEEYGNTTSLVFNVIFELNMDETIPPSIDPPPAKHAEPPSPPAMLLISRRHTFHPPLILH